MQDHQSAAAGDDAALAAGAGQGGLEWRDGRVPVSTRFQDPYFSLDHGLDETRHVFLAGNDLPARLRPGFHIAELGFGTGLNALATVAAWRAARAETARDATLPIRFTSFEGFAMSAAQMARALSAFPVLEQDAEVLVRAWEADPHGTIRLEGLELRVIHGDVRDTLPAWSGRADAWFLDGFSPARNPEMWQPELMAEVARHTAPGGSFATYTAAGFVREGLAKAGFAVERVPGFGRKRHMTRGRLERQAGHG